jgi:hypothetical protein
VSPGADLVLPGPPRGAPALASLPHGLFDDPGGLLVALRDRSDALIGAAARALAALGARATAVPALDAAAGAEAWPAAGALIAVGTVGPLGRSPLPPVPAGMLAVAPLTASSDHDALWIEGGTPDLLQAAAGALDREGLPGDAAGVDADGRVWRLDEVGPPPADRVPLAAARALGVMAVAAIAALLVWQLVLPREVAR